jgi:hypothetical protein
MRQNPLKTNEKLRDLGKKLPPSGTPTREIGCSHGRNTAGSRESGHFSVRRNRPFDHHIPMSG